MTKIIALWINESGVSDFAVEPTTTLLDLINKESLHAYDFTVDHESIPKELWATTVIYDAQEVWASKGIKGAC